MIREAIAHLVAGGSLGEDEAAAAMDEIMTGMATPSQLGAFLTALRIKGETVAEMAGLVGPKVMFLIVVAVVAIALAVGLGSGRARLRADWPPGLWGLALPWLFVPAVLLFGVSVIHVIQPLYQLRYIFFCMPAAALLAGTAVAALARGAVGWAVAVGALIVIAVAGLHAQSGQRTAAGHGYAIRQADRTVAQMARPGDALLNVSYWPLSWGGGVERGMEGEYPYGLSRLHDISQARAPVPSGATAMW